MRRWARALLGFVAADALGVCAVLPVVLGLLAAVEGVLLLRAPHGALLGLPVLVSTAFLSRSAARAPTQVLREAVRG